MQQKYQLEQASRLRLVPSTLAHIEAELQGPEYLRPLLRVDIPRSWPPGEYDRDALMYFRSRMQQGGASIAMCRSSSLIRLIRMYLRRRRCFEVASRVLGRALRQVRCDIGG